jgi:hypothetical protein
MDLSPVRDGQEKQGVEHSYVSRWRENGGKVEAVIRSYLILVDKQDKDILLNRSWYISYRHPWRSVSIQRLILASGAKDYLLNKLYISHIDRDWTNNCRYNLQNSRQ